MIANAGGGNEGVGSMLSGGGARGGEDALAQEGFLRSNASGSSRDSGDGTGVGESCRESSQSAWRNSCV